MHVNERASEQCGFKKKNKSSPRTPFALQQLFFLPTTAMLLP